MPGIGYLLGGALVALGSPRTAYAVAGAGVLVLVVVGAPAPLAARPARAMRPAAAADGRRRERSPLPGDSLAPPPRCADRAERCAAERRRARRREHQGG